MMKPFWQSKTLLVNLVAVSLSWFLNHHGIMAAAGLDADTQVILLALANMMLRMVTQQSLSSGKV